MDYKELKTLTDKIIGEAGVMSQLENEKTELEKSSAKVIAGNFDKFFVPEYENWKDIICKLAELTESYKAESMVMIQGKDTAISVRNFFAGGSYCGYFRIGSSEYDFGGLRFNLIEIINNGAEFSTRVELLETMSHFFGSEELAIKTVESYRTNIKNMLDQYEELIASKSEELRLAIQNLNYMLEGLSTVDEKEDGTVTIHLGNKTFVGKLEEAKNE